MGGEVTEVEVVTEVLQDLAKIYDAVGADKDVYPIAMYWKSNDPTFQNLHELTGKLEIELLSIHAFQPYA